MRPYQVIQKGNGNVADDEDHEIQIRLRSATLSDLFSFL